LKNIKVDDQMSESIDEGAPAAGYPSGKILFLEPFSGISGDMFLAALLDLGIDLARLEQKLRLLPLTGYAVSMSRCSRAGIQAVKFDVHISGAEGHEHHHPHEGHDHAHRCFREIRAMIEASGFSAWSTRKAVEAFRRLAEAEGKIHNQNPEDVHFHEVGAVDSIVDIVGAVLAVEELQPVRLLSAPVNVGQGTLKCRHGLYPAPGPATVELLQGIPTYATAMTGELTTPTGAALLVTLAESFGPRPLMRVERTGYGAGAREIPGAANVLRLTLGQGQADESRDGSGEQVGVIEATVDDMNPQVYGYFQERALSAGALDVYAAPVQMKKNRPGINLTVVCAPDRIEDMAALIFAETTTIGVRYTIARRRTLERRFTEVNTEFGAVTVKVALLAGRCVNFAPEYECCRRWALEKGVAMKEVMAAATRAYLELGRQ
jgi:pyridinium-3,5-bisthiocarboxylic acid mononucleotide nickel chelatase